MFNIISHQKNASKNHNEVSLHTFIRMTKIKITANTGEDVKKPDWSYIAGENINKMALTLEKKQGGFLKKLHMLTIQPAIALLRAFIPEK